MPLDATSDLTLPANGWEPRRDQLRLWRYLMNGGTRACEIAHRRWGKDDVGLHMTAIKAHLRVGTYWHMLPQANQARKAIWDAVNPRTGMRRIDEAFPEALRAVTRENEMFIRFKNGSSWQVVGSDNFNALVGSPPIGIVISEWAISNPAAWAYLSPILRENGGFVLFITTSRGKNHAKRTLDTFADDPEAFAEVTRADQTAVFTPEALAAERRELIGQYGEDMGHALFEQEYMCSFDAAILGAYWGAELAAAERDGRVRPLAIDPTMPVHDAWDIGVRDSTAIWFFQTDGFRVRVVDYYENHGKDAAHYVKFVQDRGYKRGITWLPHDAKVTEWTANRTRVETITKLGLNPRLVPDHKLMDGINSARLIIPLCEFNSTPAVQQGMEALKAYQKEWNEKMSRFSDTPLHNWASHGADAFRYLAIGWRQQVKAPEKPADRILSVGSRNQATMLDLDKTNGDNWRRR